MKKIIIILVVLVVSVPIAAKAFSFSGFIDKFFKQEVVNEIEGVEYEPLDEDVAMKKYEDWMEAYDSELVSLLLARPKSLYFTNAEANYVLQQRLDDLKNPPVDDFEVWFKDDYVYIEAHMIKYLRGDVSGEIEFVKEGRKTVPKVRKVKWGRFPLPSFIANTILKSELKEFVNFIHSNPEMQYTEVTIIEDLLEVQFKSKDS